MKLEFKIDDIDFIKKTVTVEENIFNIHEFAHTFIIISRYQGGEINKDYYLRHLFDRQKKNRKLRRKCEAGKQPNHEIINTEVDNK